MAIPEGYTPLAKIGINYKGDYVDGATYSQLDAVLYAGSTYLAVIDNPVGVPNNDGQNWRYLAKGAGEEVIKLLGNTDISKIGDGTVTGAIAYMKENGGGQVPEMIETYADIMANTVEGYTVDALAVKEGFEEVKKKVDEITTETPTSSHTVNSVSYIAKKAGIVTATLSITTTADVAQYTNIANMPLGYRPSGYVYARTSAGNIIVAVLPDGNIQTMSEIAAGTTISFSVTYVCR